MRTVITTFLIGVVFAVAVFIAVGARGQFPPPDMTEGSGTADDIFCTLGQGWAYTKRRECEQNAERQYNECIRASHCDSMSGSAYGLCIQGAYIQCEQARSDYLFGCRFVEEIGQSASCDYQMYGL
ncbi:MAG: hypothetical protein OXI79_12335 [Gammaproteobacteria bacterium]|nr:hypothetical protein [Gammaproteobacteria bacterium]